MHPFHAFLKPVKILHEKDDNLKAQQRLRAGQHHASLRQHVLDLIGEWSAFFAHLSFILLVFVGGHIFFRFLIVQITEAVPENHGKRTQRDGRSPGHAIAGKLLCHHEDACSQACGKGQQPKIQDHAGKIFNPGSLLAALRNLVESSRKQKRPQPKDHQPQAAKLGQLSGRRNTGKIRLKEDAEVNADQHLRAENQNADIIQPIFNLVFEFCHRSRSNGDFSPGLLFSCALSSATAWQISGLCGSPL